MSHLYMTHCTKRITHHTTQKTHHTKLITHHTNHTWYIACKLQFVTKPHNYCSDILLVSSNDVDKWKKISNLYTRPVIPLGDKMWPIQKYEQHVSLLNMLTMSLPTPHLNATYLMIRLAASRVNACIVLRLHRRKVLQSNGWSWWEGMLWTGGRRGGGDGTGVTWIERQGGHGARISQDRYRGNGSNNGTLWPQKLVYAIDSSWQWGRLKII